jgi:hypothetical protein
MDLSSDQFHSAAYILIHGGERESIKDGGSGQAQVQGSGFSYIGETATGSLSDGQKSVLILAPGPSLRTFHSRLSRLKVL